MAYLCGGGAKPGSGGKRCFDLLGPAAFPPPGVVGKKEPSGEGLEPTEEENCPAPPADWDWPGAKADEGVGG